MKLITMYNCCTLTKHIKQENVNATKVQNEQCKWIQRWQCDVGKGKS